ncbi:NAD-dependent epimerase/dehydratase family protein [Tunturibacter empetritectus]|uniref:Nucleoside-diphosphate-sugar epimerase n=1 Tax=Tunturiibacter empetritectus TaxID=3069691 RepID=A0A7W8IHS8_9BACT|nr:NAD-dependent epimerase/dehydratase family protein [Edaphobacter lichenicola]MBB5316478.1 nucleoside-diphosphate-sugar epimerase [Edaphobacter lichenicola]
MLRSADLSGKRVVVTGATGFLGGYVVDQLQRADATVIAVADRSRTARRPEHPARSIETLWFDRPDKLAESVQSAKPDYVVHLHAAVTTNRSAEAVRSTLETNLLPSLDLMTACAEMQVKRLILLGSGEEFGPVTGPFDENTASDPASPYGASKAAITAYARMFHRAFQLPVVVLRPSVVYGPFQAPRMLIPQVLQSLFEGKEIAVTEGRQTRDFIHVEDVAKGVVSALVREGVEGRSFNLASGEVVTVRDCLERIERITRRHGLIRYGALPYKTGEIFSYEPIAETTFSALNWRPAISLEEGLTKTWKSVRDC